MVQFRYNSTKEMLINGGKGLVGGMRFLAFNDWDSLKPIEYKLRRINTVLIKRYGLQPHFFIPCWARKL